MLGLLGKLLDRATYVESDGVITQSGIRDTPYGVALLYTVKDRRSGKERDVYEAASSGNGRTPLPTGTVVSVRALRKEAIALNGPEHWYHPLVTIEVHEKRDESI